MAWNVKARDIRNNAKLAMREARRYLGAEDRISITCGDGFEGYGWYAFVTDYPDEGSIKLDAPPLPRSMTKTSERIDPMKQRSA